MIYPVLDDAMTPHYRNRIALQIGMADPYWVQVRDAIVRHANQRNLELVSLSIDADLLLNPAKAEEIFEELQVQQVQALICNSVAEALVHKVTAQHIPVIDASESFIECPLFTSRRGLYDAAFAVGQWLNERIPDQANVLVVGCYDDMGQSRLQGITDSLRMRNVTLLHVPTTWLYSEAFVLVKTWLASWHGPIHAVFGLSDSLAMAGRDVLAQHQRLTPDIVITGINGDALALADISRGRMHMTVETVVDSFAVQMIDLALIGISTGELPATYDPPRRIIDHTNVHQVAMDKLISLAELPSQLVGFNRQREQQRMRQLETSLAITQRVGGILDHQHLMREISELVQTIYGYHRVMLWRFNANGELVGANYQSVQLRSTPLIAALRDQAPVFIPDALHSQRFAPDDEYPTTRTRLILPIRVNTQIVGLVDLQSDEAIPHSRDEIDGLQLVADQIGIALQNIDLYQAAKHAQQVAEQADLLKTRLLANVSHELRTPLHIILGYSQLLITDPQPHGVVLGDEIRHDLRTIQHSAEHLIHLINDLLDVSRAEINELVLYPEMTDIYGLLISLFGELRHTFKRNDVLWRHVLPANLPLMYIDANRVRQIITNILSNAAKFTMHGEIVLGAHVEPPYLHIWVKDSGIGIPSDQHDRIFEPFVTIEQPHARRAGVGLGLTITRRLVALHRGILTVESTEGEGSIFHCYLPLRGLATDQPVVTITEQPAVMVVLGLHSTTSVTISALADSLKLPIYHAQSSVELDSLMVQLSPTVIVWDTAMQLPDEVSLLNWIQAHPQLGHIPFLIYDSRHSDSQTPILQKPVNNSQFVEAVRMLVMHHQTPQSQVLIVDDDATMHELYRNLLVSQSPTVAIQSCMNGAHAQHLLSQGYMPNLIVLDLMMHDFDGFALLEWIRAQPQFAQVPVLVISGKVLTREEIQRLQYPNTMVRPKLGSDPTNLQDALMQLLGNPHTNPPHLGTAARQAMAFIQQHYMQRITREQIAHAAGVSESYLTQVFQHELGMTPWVYLTRFRVAHACALLRNTDDSITDIAVSVGFDDPGYFSKVFRGEIGKTPREFRQHATTQNA
jgi:signal transduction histidine kinase/AraC-like DNA-binding protein/ABC-type sugar transport system substrate-binding protein